MDEDVANLLHEARELLGEDAMPNTPRAAAKDSSMVARGSTAHPLDMSTEDQDWALVADAMDSALRWRQLGSATLAAAGRLGFTEDQWDERDEENEVGPAETKSPPQEQGGQQEQKQGTQLLLPPPHRQQKQSRRQRQRQKRGPGHANRQPLGATTAARVAAVVAPRPPAAAAEAEAGGAAAGTSCISPGWGWLVTLKQQGGGDGGAAAGEAKSKKGKKAKQNKSNPPASSSARKLPRRLERGRRRGRRPLPPPEDHSEPSPPPVVETEATSSAAAFLATPSGKPPRPRGQSAGKRAAPSSTAGITMESWGTRARKRAKRARRDQGLSPAETLCTYGGRCCRHDCYFMHPLGWKPRVAPAAGLQQQQQPLEECGAANGVPPHGSRGGGSAAAPATLPPLPPPAESAGAAATQRWVPQVVQVKVGERGGGGGVTHQQFLSARDGLRRILAQQGPGTGSTASAMQLDPDL
jgi:hypothetical protein